MQPIGWREDGLPLMERIAKCEKLYNEAGQDTVFKMTPYVRPADLDGHLDAREYRLEQRSKVLVRELAELERPLHAEVRIEEAMNEEWLTDAAQILGYTEHKAAVTRKIVGNIRMKTAFGRLWAEGRPVACGFAVVEDDWVGFYDVGTKPDHRGRGYAHSLLLHLLEWAAAQGAAHSYLLVLGDNAPTLRLYEKLGYREVYSYWYRVKRREGLL